MKTFFQSSIVLATVLLVATGAALGQTGTKRGTAAMPNVTTGYNSAYGYSALNKLNSNATHNTGLGFNSIFWATSSRQNTATGVYALTGNNSMTGISNTASGAWALNVNTTGNYGTAMGYRSLYHNTGGSFNTGLGGYTLSGNTLGSYNTGMGFAVLGDSLTGSSNVGIGCDVMSYKPTGSYNVALGEAANRGGGDGTANVAHGMLCLQTVEGDQNTGFGVQVMTGGKGCMWNTGVGVQALWRSTGRNNIGIGDLAGYYLDGAGDNNIYIGSYGQAGDNGTIRIAGNFKKIAYLAGVRGVTIPSGVRVLVNSDGKLGTLTSSRKYKEDIADMGASSDVLRRLRPVTFHYKPELDREQIPQFGLIAEEVGEVSPDLVARDEKGEIYTVRYESVNAMLLNEFQKQHHSVTEQAAKKSDQKRRLAAQEETIGAQQKQFEELSRRMSALKAELAAAATKVD